MKLKKDDILRTKIDWRLSSNLDSLEPIKTCDLRLDKT